MIETALGFVVIFMAGEIFALIIFGRLRRHFDVFKTQRHLFSTDEEDPGRPPATEVVKGILERLVVTYGLFIELPGILTVFAALKLANRLTHEGDHSDRSKNYFLIGNLLTILLCLGYYKIATEFSGDIGSRIISYLLGPTP